MVKERTRSIEEQYIAEHPRSYELYQRERAVVPGGVTHDVRHVEPFPLYIERAHGSRKWDVDGHELIGYAMGHGALILGHSHPAVVEAVDEQMAKGTHYGASHLLEIEWAEEVQRLIPSAERVKFTSSGTEATMMALRLARAYTGRPKILKFAGHFHGWHDYALPAQNPPFDQPPPGVPPALLDTVVVAPNNDLDYVEEYLARPDHGVAAVILEPSGASYATVPLPDGFLRRLREITARRDVILIFDEVVTGFRWSPGGVQGLTGITPDLTTLAKILAGGLPGGAVAGREEIMALLEFRDAEWNRTRKVAHPGTYNANPLSAAAGVTALRLVADPGVQRHADASARALKIGFNEAFQRQGVPGFAYGESSIVNTVIGTPYPGPLPLDLEHPEGVDARVLKARGPEKLLTALHAGAVLEGVDLWHGGGAILSVAHTDADIARTIAAFDRTLARMKDEGLFD
ncbi:MAG TPA: aspartate aminotransferase family protein [Thermomicrobiales bacterium]|nr:aspartate aminotransferase family protein [Thermomicrobiales bacterium]